MVWSSSARMRMESPRKRNLDTGDLKFPVPDNSDILQNKPNTIDLKPPKNIERKVEYDPTTKQYIITETIGGRFFRNPQYLSFEEYQRYESEQNKSEYWKQRSSATDLVQSKGIVPKLYVNNQIFDRIFGGGAVDIRPQGSAELIFSGKFNRNENPAFSERAKRTGNFDFDEKIQMNVVGNIGDKLKVTTNFNTESQFDFENQVKLDYTGYEDEIIKKIEAGNVSLPISGSLITGSQTLFGIKTQLQFGRLTMTSVFSTQKSEPKEINITNGAQTSDFRFSADNYEANKHYFLANYFKDNYEKAFAEPPLIQSKIIVNQVEVYITNETNKFDDSRNVIAFIDLGEDSVFNNIKVIGGTSKLPNSKLDTIRDPETGKEYALLPSNDLLSKLPGNIRNFKDNQIDSYFQSETPAGSSPNDNYAKLTNARKLNQREFSFSPTLGYISLNRSLNAAEVLSVSFRYTYDGVEYQVGEFSADRPLNPLKPDVLYTKLLKNATLKTNLPIWDLMMKNIYPLGSFQINEKNFRLNIVRLDEATGIERQVLTDGIRTSGQQYIQLLNVDRINTRQANRADGIFDFIDGVTIDRANGKIIFPVREPFGSNLRRKFDPSETAFINKYVFQQLYDTTKNAAQQVPEQNKYFIQGSYQSTSSSEFSLNAINIPPGSVVVTAGSTVLTEGSQYTVDYNIGRVKIIDESYLNSAVPIKIKLEAAQLFNLQTKTFLGTRLDYKFSDKFTIGGTALRLSERPFTQKVNIGEEPISNSIYGLDGNYQADSRFLTNLVDKIPFIETKENSQITLSGEYAYLQPGHSRQLNVPGNKTGISYLDDFEGSKSIIDLKNAQQWFLSSTPQTFPNAGVSNRENGFDRAQLSWYSIDQLFYQKNNNISPRHIRDDKEQLSNHYVRQVLEQQVFPNRLTESGQANILTTFDLTFDPIKRGPYNYRTTELNPNGDLLNPKKKWGGIYRGLTSTDFEALNVEFIEFWVMDPFFYKPDAQGGDLYFNLGSISEDVLKDGRKSVENGLPVDGENIGVDTTVFARIPSIEPVTQAFDNNPTSRQNQDVGLDGLSSGNEQTFFGNYLQELQNSGLEPDALTKAQNDPSNDDYVYFRGTDLDNDKADILTRYSRLNGTEGNSKTSEQSLADFGVEVGSTTLQPDAEDANRDNNSSKEDEYFEYKISMRPADLVVGQNYITDQVLSTVKLENGKTESIRWLQFNVPIISGTPRGGIQDFKSVRFIRMYMTEFEEATTLRFARLQLDRGEWRKFIPQPGRPLREPDDYIGEVDDNTSIFDVNTVNIEENATRIPIPYILPPGILQERNASSIRGNTRQNEQSLVLRAKELRDGYGLAAYKNTDFDFRSYKRIEMFIHAEGNQLEDGDVSTFIRLGTDFTQNYYEYEIPMQITKDGSQTESEIWPESNKFNIPLSVLQNAKQARNNANASLIKEFYFPDGKNRVTVVGSPDLSRVRTILIGVRNPKRRSSNQSTDDGQNISAEIWVNELRLTDFDEDGGWAALARATFKLADFGTVNLAGSRSTPGFGSIDKKVSERSREDATTYDVSTNVEIGKFFPEKTGIKIPVFYNYSQTIIKPQFSPSSPDILLNDLLEQTTGSKRDTLKNLTIDKTTRKSINFTNIRKEKTKPNAKSRIYDIENVNASYSYTNKLNTSYEIEKDLEVNHRGRLGYNFSISPKTVKPFEKFIKSKNLNLIKDFNFNYLPSSLSFSVDVDRLYSENQVRNLDPTYIPPSNFSPINYNKYFRLNRVYGFNYNITRGLKIDFNANNEANIDEPDGKIETRSQKDTVLSNLKQFGRTTRYEHNFNVTYTVPINKFPFLDWTKLDVRYGGRFGWDSKPLSQIENKDTSKTDLGNTIQNSRIISVNPTLTFTTLYNKSKFLKSLNTPKRPPPRKPAAKDERGLNVKELNKLSNNGKPIADSLEKVKKPSKQILLKTGARLLTSIKTVSGVYSRTESTVLPGYLPVTNNLGYDFKKSAPGIPFLLGQQDDNFAKYAADKGWITSDTNLTAKYAQNFSETIQLRATIEPLPDFRIELTANRNYSNMESSNFRFVNDTLFKRKGFRKLSPVETGSFSITTITVRTIFDRQREPTYSSKNFQKFESNLIAISKRLGEENGTSISDTSDFYNGYGAGNQEVLINAFLAAYTGTDPSKQKLDLFTKIPLPNWQINYTGLTKIQLLADLFANISLKSSYSSTYSISGFRNLLQFNTDPGGERELDPLGNFLPQYQVASVGIDEKFTPLVGIDVKLKNSMTFRFDYNTTRRVAFLIGSNNVQQTSGDGFAFSFGYITNNFKVPFKINGKIAELKNNLKFDMQFRITNTLDVIYRLGVPLTTPGSGSRILALNPSIDYVVNERFNVRAFYDYTLNKPKSSISYLTAFTQAGVSIRFTLGN